MDPSEKAIRSILEHTDIVIHDGIWQVRSMVSLAKDTKIRALHNDGLVFVVEPVR